MSGEALRADEPPRVAAPGALPGELIAWSGKHVEVVGTDRVVRRGWIDEITFAVDGTPIVLHLLDRVSVRWALPWVTTAQVREVPS